MSVAHFAEPVCKQLATDPAPTLGAGYFAFARIQGEVKLVQVSYATPSSALTLVDAKIFRHEFITIFRFEEARTLHPADICILETIDDNLTRYEEDNETVFLARDLMDHMRKLTGSQFTIMQQTRRYHMVHSRQRQRQR